MTYLEKLVAVVKVNGQVLREDHDTVTLPFGSEYSLLVKNLDSVRIQIKVAVNGQDATEDTHLIVQPNDSIELERFIRNGNLSAGNRFKFIARTGDVERTRGIQVDDGLIRVEAWREFIQPVVNVPIVHYYDPHYYVKPPVWPSWPPHVTYTYSMNADTGYSSRGLCGMSVGAGADMASANMVQSDAGITVPGSESHQQFTSVLGFPLETQSRVIVLRLRGQVGGRKAGKAVTVKTKPRCSTCGKVNRALVRFCASCGTSLILI